MGHRIAPIYHSQSGPASFRSGERISRLGGQKIEVRGKDEKRAWEDRSESDRKTRTQHVRGGHGGHYRAIVSSEILGIYIKISPFFFFICLPSSQSLIACKHAINCFHDVWYGKSVGEKGDTE